MTTDATTTTSAKPTRARRATATVTAPTPAPMAPAAAPAAKPTSKSDAVIKLLLRAKGATRVELIAATDWQPHSLRAFLSGLRKKGRVIVRETRKSGGFAYRIVVAASGLANDSGTADCKPLMEAGDRTAGTPADGAAANGGRSADGAGEG